MSNRKLKIMALLLGSGAAAKIFPNQLSLADKKTDPSKKRLFCLRRNDWWGMQAKKCASVHP
jgi:hypothetical protein